MVAFSRPHGEDPSSVFFRRIVIEPAFDPRGTGFWKRQLRARVVGRHGIRESPALPADYLTDIRLLWDVFDEVEDLRGLSNVLNPPQPATLRVRVRQQLAWGDVIVVGQKLG